MYLKLICLKLNEHNCKIPLIKINKSIILLNCSSSVKSKSFVGTTIHGPDMTTYSHGQSVYSLPKSDPTPTPKKKVKTGSKRELVNSVIKSTNNITFHAEFLILEKHIRSFFHSGKMEDNFRRPLLRNGQIS